MKKTLSVILIITLLLFLTSCKRGYETEGSIDISDFVENESEKLQSGNKESSDDSQASKSQQSDEEKIIENDTKTEQTLDEILHEQQSELNSDNQDETKIETSEMAALKENINKNMFVTKDHSTDVYVEEYLPYKLGYVEKIENADGTFYYSAVKDKFVTKQPITEQMVNAATKYPYLSGEYNPDYFKLRSVITDQTTLDQLEQDMGDSSVIVKGHFEKSYGTAVGYYEKITTASTINYTCTEFTLYNFVIDKVYTSDSEYKSGDVVEIALDGTVLQGTDGYYRSTSSVGWNYYMNFSNATLEERTYIISFFKEDDKFNVNRIGLLRQNVYEQLPEKSQNRTETISYQIQQKYN